MNEELRAWLETYLDAYYAEHWEEIQAESRRRMEEEIIGSGNPKFVGILDQTVS